ncbi:MAG TPA: ATP-binding protein [Pyrinomonadaceae bacterium]|nr:ATP-binding protein [Pyrinomonadaceae bacterium]
MSVATVERPTSAASRIVDFESAELATTRDNVLIVGHLPKIRSRLASELSSIYNCGEASSTIEAMGRLREETFSVVITETMLQGLSGIELLRLVIRDYPDTAVIVLSEIDRPQRALDAVRLGAFDYLLKPCEPIVLQMTVERAIERRRLLIDARRYKQDLEQRNLELEQGKRELQRLQAQIVHSEKMTSLGQLAAGVAHELNNPVGFVYGNLDLLKERLDGLGRLLHYYDQIPLTPEAAAEVDAIKQKIDYDRSKKEVESMIDDCLEGAVRIRDIVRNLRTFSHLDEAEIKRTDIHEGIDSTLRILSKYFSAENITLVKDYGELPKVEAYPGQLNQVWMNLLVNAAQAIGGARGEVTIQTRAINNMVKISVSDTGPGISPECVDKIFDPFFTTKPVGEGAGLGLSISFGIIERHGGRIDVINWPGEGARFIVLIPINARCPIDPKKNSVQEG